jgi:gliding motility-associated-like protein
LEIKSGCKTGTDAITISIAETPQPFSLGEDEISCSVKATTLTPPVNASVILTWQDGSHGPTFDINNFGSYWVTIENQCGVASDTMHITKLEMKTVPPNVITPNGDGKNDVFKLETEVIGKVDLEIFNRWGNSVYSAKNYTNTWSGADLSPGIYFYLITSECFKEIRGPVSVLNN